MAEGVWENHSGRINPTAKHEHQLYAWEAACVTQAHFSIIGLGEALAALKFYSHE